MGSNKISRKRLGTLSRIEYNPSPQTWRFGVRDLKFHYASAKNFICFGPEGIELFFDNYGSLVLVRGENLDDGTNKEPASNGAGKSTLQDIISYALYGRTVKSPKQLSEGEVINSLTEKGLVVEVQFDDHRVVRYRKPNKLKVWKSKDHIWDKETEVTMGTMRETQKYIEKIIGLTHRAFCNIIVFDDSNSHSFLESDGPTKRKITENLLGLDTYREHHESAKELRKSIKKSIEGKSIEYERLKVEIKNCDERVSMVTKKESDWRKGVENKITELKSEILSKQQELSSTDEGKALAKYQEAQEQLLEKQGKVDEFDHKRDRLNGIVADANEKLEKAREQKQSINLTLQEKNLKIKSLKEKLETNKELVVSLESLEDGQVCPTCHGKITKENYGSVLTHAQNIVNTCASEIQKLATASEKDTESFKAKSAIVSKLEDHIKEANKTVTNIEDKLSTLRQEVVNLGNIKKPEGNSAQQILETEIVDLKKLCKSKEEEFKGDSPYKEILESTIKEQADRKNEIEQKKEEIKKVESLVPYVDFWFDAFSDKGIRKFVVEGAIPALNSRVSYWLQHLIDNKIEVIFDNQLDIEVKRNGAKANYYSMSNGEKRRINLAVSQAFSYVMMLHSGSCPSLVFLDEITGGGIDRVGVTGVYNMVFELAKERQVFVTTHNENLLDMLQGCESLTLRKKDDVTKLVS